MRSSSGCTIASKRMKPMLDSSYKFNFLSDFVLNLMNSLIQIPPPPPRPDFDSSREKLQKLGEGEGSMTAEEFKKMKQELEA